MRFDKVLNRRHTGAVKYDVVDHPENVAAYLAPYLNEETLMMWVADMDYEVPSQVREVLSKRLEHEIFGYTLTPEAYYEALINWYREQYDYEIKKEEVALVAGVVPGINQLIRCFTQPGDEILIQSPVYHQFAANIEKTGRKVLDVPLIEKEDNYYLMDLEKMEEAISEKTKMMILCSPHNPVGRVWTQEELKALGDLLARKGILLISDEIHGDILREGVDFTVFNKVDPAFKEFTILASAPNKTFNIAGFKTGNVIIQNKDLYQQFAQYQEDHALTGFSILASLAQMTVYQEGRAWYEAMIKAVDENIAYVLSFFEEKIPEIKIRRPEGTYLLWLNCRALGLQGQDLELFFLKEANVFMNAGQAFSSNYADHMRMNVATSLENVKEACSRIEQAVAQGR